MTRRWPPVKKPSQKAQRFARAARGTDWLAYGGFIIAATHPQGFAILAGGRTIDHAPTEAEARAKIDLYSRNSEHRSEPHG